MIYPKDYYLSSIKEGSPVAFNYSGDVRLGIVREVKRVETRRNTSKPYTVIIEHADGSGIKSLKNHRGIVVMPFSITIAKSFPTHD